jgi:hypothetical protein
MCLCCVTIMETLVFSFVFYGVDCRMRRIPVVKFLSFLFFFKEK